MLDRLPTAFDEKIYSADWCAWRDPEIPEWIDPIGVLLERHLGTPTQAKRALVADGQSVSYGDLSKLVRQYSAGLASTGLRPEARMLLFGTDSLDYVLIWLAAIRLGAVPVVVSDLYKPRELLYFLADTGVRRAVHRQRAGSQARRDCRGHSSLAPNDPGARRWRG